MTKATTESLNSFIQKQHALIKELQSELAAAQGRVSNLEKKLKTQKV